MKFFKNKFFLVFAIFTFLKPSGFDLNNMENINLFFNYARMLFAVLIAVKYFTTVGSISRLIFAELLFFGCILLSTVNNDSDFSPFFIFSVSAVVFTMLIEICSKESIRIFIEALFINYFIIIVGNLILMHIVFGFQVGNNTDDLNYTFSFLSSKNMTSTYIFPALCSGFLYSSLKKRGKYNLFSIILYVSIVLTEIMLWSATALVGVFLLLFYFYVIYGNKLERIINTKVLLIVGVFIVIGFTFGGIQEFFSFIIVDILKKDLTMTGRTNVWKIGITGFMEKPLLGNGYEAMTIDNGVIQVLFRSGIFGFIFLIALLVIGSKIQLANRRNQSIYALFVCFLFVIFIMSISESWFDLLGFYIILALMFYSHILIPLPKKNEQYRLQKNTLHRLY